MKPLFRKTAGTVTSTLWKINHYIDIKRNPNAGNAPKIEWEQIKGLTLSLGKMMLGGRMDEATGIQCLSR